VAKQKRTRKNLEDDIRNVGAGLSNIYMEVEKLNTFMIGLENLIMYLAEHLEKKESFEKFIGDKMEEHKKSMEKEAKVLKNKEGK
jgi:hypothetical protein